MNWYTKHINCCSNMRCCGVISSFLNLFRSLFGWNLYGGRSSVGLGWCRSYKKWCTAFLSLAAVACLIIIIIIMQTGSWYLFYHLIPEERGWLPMMNEENETLQCTMLLQAARKILDGEKICLPHSGKATLWPFKKRVPRTDILKDIQYKNSSESPAETLRKLRLYNVSVNDIAARKLFITFGHNCCLYSKQRALHRAKTVGGFDFVHSFNLHSMTPKFCQTHHNILRTRRGAGYWLWKPYILLKVLIENMAEGDLVMYQDAGAYLIRSAAPVLKLCKESKHGVIIFNLDSTEHDYTKRDAMILMNMNISEATETRQRLASYLVVKKTCHSIQFVMEWLAYLSDRRIASDDANTLGFKNVKSFVDHRHDQSVISLLSKKWGIPAFRDPSQYGIPSTDDPIDYSAGPYEQLIIHDRFKH